MLRNPESALQFIFPSHGRDRSSVGCGFRCPKGNSDDGDDVEVEDTFPA
jgi:hypothetical protein